MCDRCAPLEPYDAEYQKEHGIKHLSYYAYSEKLKSSSGGSLETPSYRVQVPCLSGNHAPWPQGICSHCQPSAITLVSQPFRMVDHVEFADPGMVDQLISYWRATGTQRLGFLIGRYRPYEDVPMGIKAVVEGIYEPEQETFADGLSVRGEMDVATDVATLVASLGLDVLGVIFTDLKANADEPGKVVPKRHTDTFTLSSLEIVLAATLQKRRPVPGLAASRFVTCVVTGDADGQIAVSAYQVSEQAVALVEADLVEPSVDPGLMRVKPETDSGDIQRRYVPDVFFRHRNEYGYDVQENAKPCFPVEYLLVSLTHGFPTSPNPFFVSPNPFVVEHRDSLQKATLGVVAARLRDLEQANPLLHIESDATQDPYPLLLWLSDLHLLVYLVSLGVFTPADLALLGGVVQNRDLALLQKLTQSPGWLTFLALVNESAPQPSPQYQQQHFSDGFEIPPDVDVPPDAPPAAGEGPSSSSSEEKVCAFCTFANPSSARDCEMCGLPLNS